MASNTAKFTKAAKAAKKLYKTGRYKTYGDAVAAAYKKLKSSGGKTKFRQTGHSNLMSDAKRQAKRPGKRTSASGKTYYERRKNRSDVPFALTGVTSSSLTRELKKRLQDQLAIALLRRDMALSKRIRKMWQEKVKDYKAQLRKLS